MTGKTEELGEKPAPVLLCPPQIPHGLSRARTRASAMRGRRLTTWAMARPQLSTYFILLRFQFLTVAILKMKTFWNTAQCSLLEVRGGFGGAYCLHYQTDYGSNKHLWYVSQLHWYCSAQYPRRPSSSHFILLPLNTCRNENTHGL
jgi:hypothetical protein